MPSKPPRPCRTCKQSTAHANGYCDQHQTDAIGWKRSQAGKTTTQRGYGYRWRKLRNAVLERDNFLCIPCAKRGIYSPASEVDHIINKKAGGSDEMCNLQSICPTCHAAKTQKEARKQENTTHRGVVKSL